MMEVLTSVQRHMQGNATVMMGAIFALLMGLTPAVVTLAVYFVNGGDAAACDRPLARWLLVNGIRVERVRRPKPLDPPKSVPASTLELCP